MIGTQNVASILKEKGDRVISVLPDDSIDTVTQVLARGGVGAVLVRDAKGSVLGVLSERDIVRALARDGAGIMQDRASSIMTRNVVYCRLNDTVQQVMQQMTNGRFRHMPVIENGELRGMISVGDVVKWRIMEAEQEAEHLKQYIAAG